MPYVERIEYADSAMIRRNGPFAGEMLRVEQALCPDGKRRNAFPSNDGVADTFFSIPAFVYVGKKRVYGYVTIETLNGFSTPSESDPETIKFIPYTYRKHYQEVMPK